MSEYTHQPTPDPTENASPVPAPAGRHFKRPLLVTGIAVSLALVLGLAGVAWIHRTTKADWQRSERTKTLGQVLGIATLVVIFPYWILAADKVGKERRAARAVKDA
jgi:hypothetical protein